MHLSQTASLTKLTEEKQAFQSIPEVEAAFQALYEALCMAPMLANSQPRETFIVDTGANNVVTGGVLSQVLSGQEGVIAYYNKTLNMVERNYCITRRELLPIVRTMEHYH
jgi:hypothetical protein